MADSDEKQAAYEHMWRFMVKMGIAERKDREGDERDARSVKLVCGLMVEIGDDPDLARVVCHKLEELVDSLQLPPCDDEDLLCRAFHAACAGTWEFQASGKPKSMPDGILVFYRGMLRGEEVMRKAAAIFTRVLADTYDVGLRTRLLIGLAWVQYFEAERRGAILESDVQASGRLVWNLLTKTLKDDFKHPDAGINDQVQVDSRAANILKSFELMGHGSLEHGIPRQPVEVLRGLLFTASSDHAAANTFWRMAAESQAFPCEVFTEPCRGMEGQEVVAITLFQGKALASFFSSAPEVAVKRFARVIKEGLDAKWQIVRDDKNTVRKERVALSAEERANVLRDIAAAIDDSVRKYAVADMLGVSL